MRHDTSTSHDVALLAPVPLVHLRDGVLVCREQGRVAFGSRAWELFRELDRLRAGFHVTTYIYASHTEAPFRPAATWQGLYCRQVDSVNGAHPQGMKIRPASTGRNPDDNLGHWAVFWELCDLYEHSADKSIPLTRFLGLGKKVSYGKSFVPEGPLLVEVP